MLRQSAAHILQQALKIANSSEEQPVDARIDADKLLSLKLRLKILEVKKYPAEVFDVKHFLMPVNGQDAQVLTVRAKPGQRLHEQKHLTEMSIYSLEVRKLSIIGGILQAMDVPGFAHADHELKATLEDLIQKAQQSTVDSLAALQANPAVVFKPKEALAKFIDDLTVACNVPKGISGNSDEVINKIRASEKFFVADLNANRILINEYESAGKSYFSMDLPENNVLSDQQFSALQEIESHPNDDNRWFSYLPVWERNLIRRMNSAANFDNLFQSSAMQGLPGIKNARTNYMLVSDPQGNYQTLSNMVKTSTPDPYEMPERFRHEQTVMNIHQIINATKPIAETLRAEWADVLKDQTPKPLYYFQSLLSDNSESTYGAKVIAGESLIMTDRELVLAQDKAYRKVASDRPDLKIIAANDALNFYRVFNRVNSDTRWYLVNQLLDYAKPFINFSPQLLTPALVERQNIIKQAAACLKKLKLTSMISLRTNRRNATAFKVAYASILAENMGGTAIINCKSGKDRTGVHELYCRAMRIYFSEFNVLPNFDDTGELRLNFIKIFVAEFSSWKAQEAAAANTPGSLGLKDSQPSYLLCADIRSALDEHKLHTNSNDLASLNKSGKISKSEKMQTVATNKLDQAALSGRKAQRTIFSVKDQKQISAFTQAFKIKRLQADENDLANPYDFLNHHQSSANYLLPAAAQHKIINFVPDLRDKDKVPGVFSEKKTFSGDMFIEIVKLPPTIAAAEIFIQVLSSAPFIANLPADMDVEMLRKAFANKTPTLPMVTHFFAEKVSQGLTFNDPHTPASVAQTLISAYTDRTQKTIDGYRVPNAAYLEFAYAQIMAFRAQYPNDTMIIYRNTDHLLSMAYELVCLSGRIPYEKPRDTQKLNPPPAVIHFVAKTCADYKNLASGPANIPAPLPIAVHAIKVR